MQKYVLRALLSIGTALSGCSEPRAAAEGQPAVNATSDAKLITRKFGKPVSMSASKPCGNSRLERSLCMVELMLTDIRKTYDWLDGGGIADIKEASPTSYTVSLPQEERTDLITYEFAITEQVVSIKTKTQGTESYGRRQP